MLEPDSRTARILDEAGRRLSGRSQHLLWGALTAVAMTGALGATLLMPPRPWLVWNASASAPIGLYAVTASHHGMVGDMVIARVPVRWRDLAATRRYIPANVPLVKRVAAASGDRICASGRAIFINGRWFARRQAVDSRGRAMPWWQGCVTLGKGRVFLLMDAPDSFDGRYFGPTDRGDIIGRARLLWRR
ncbi:MAG TPA: S26 family signal peptidase, partial [Novosphingobium sp.]|nr:S26 family signal peptidase [Novosphingobium sp.]